MLFPDFAGKEPQSLLDGSARIALQTEPRFDKYIFIERSVERCAHLEESITMSVLLDEPNSGTQATCVLDEPLMVLGDAGIIRALRLVSNRDGHPTVAAIAAFRLRNREVILPDAVTEPIATALLECDDVEPATRIA